MALTSHTVCPPSTPHLRQSSVPLQAGQTLLFRHGLGEKVRDDGCMEWRMVSTNLILLPELLQHWLVRAEVFSEPSDVCHQSLPLLQDSAMVHAVVVPLLLQADILLPTQPVRGAPSHMHTYKHIHTHTQTHTHTPTFTLLSYLLLHSLHFSSPLSLLPLLPPLIS